MALLACHRPAPPPPAPEPTPAAKEVKAPPPPTQDEQEMMKALSGQGASALAGLGSQADVAHGATWFQGSVPAQGSTAYLLLGKLGEAGASTLRFVLRHQGQRAANFIGCTVSVDGNEVGSFSPAPNKFEKLPDGSVLQIADIQFEDVRPIVLTMINGQSAVIRTGNGQEIRVGRSELEDMRRVLSAYLHLQASP
jgi:hypothetical protein